MADEFHPTWHGGAVDAPGDRPVPSDRESSRAPLRFVRPFVPLPAAAASAIEHIRRRARTPTDDRSRASTASTPLGMRKPIGRRRAGTEIAILDAAGHTLRRRGRRNRHSRPRA